MKRRLKKLEKCSAEPGILEISLKESGLDSVAYHWRRAQAQAIPSELEELKRCRKAFREEGSEAIDDPHRIALMEIMERIMQRESPVLANDFRIHRDALWRELERLEEEWREQIRNSFRSYADPAFWSLATAETNRRRVVNEGGALVTDLEEARRIVQRITDAGSIEEVLRYVGWYGDEGVRAM